MWSPKGKAWSPKIKNVESKILHLICSLTTISGKIKNVKVTACTLRSDDKHNNQGVLYTLSWKLIPPTFVQQLMASSSSPDNPPNSSQVC